MRTSISFCGFGMVVLVIGWLSLSVATPAPADPKKEMNGGDDRQQLADKLLERTSLKEPLDNVTLKIALDFLSERYDITILADNSLSAEVPVALNAAENAALNQTISVPAMKNVRLGTIMHCIVDQINGVYLIYPDHIKIVSTQRAYSLTRPNLAPSSDEMDQEMETPEGRVRSIPLVTVNFGERNLVDALRDIEIRTNTTIVLANQASDKAKTPIQARFTNVPVDSAVATLAEMAGLKMARRGNVLLVTTAERAKELNPAPQAVSGFGGVLPPKRMGKLPLGVSR